MCLLDASIFNSKAVSQIRKTLFIIYTQMGMDLFMQDMLENYDTDEKGMVNIRDFSEEQLRKVLKQSIQSLSPVEKTTTEEAIIGDSKEERWVDSEKNLLVLINENDSWNIYFGLNLDASFDTYEEAETFLQEEGFTRK